MKTSVVLAGFLALLLILYLATNVRAGRIDASCWFADGYLYATGLPIGVAFSITPDPYPTGTTQYTDDGTWSGPTSLATAYFWVRGHGPSLIKAGKQLNDYHVVAMCAA